MVLRALRRRANYMVSPAELKGYQGVTLPWLGAFPADPRHDLIGFAEEGFRKGDGTGSVSWKAQFITTAFSIISNQVPRESLLAAQHDGIPVEVIPCINSV